jgi:hypothetical protein
MVLLFVIICFILLFVSVEIGSTRFCLTLKQRREQRMFFRIGATGLMLILVLTLVVTGCGRGDGMVSISGTVTLDGVPLETGAMTIGAGDSPVAGCEVKDGKFSVRTTKGD